MDNFTNPTANDSLNLPSHSTQHANANDAIEAIEGYLLTGAGKTGLVHLSTTAFTGVGVFAIDGAFTSAYANYRVMVDYSGSGSYATLNFQFRNGGAVVGGAGADYYGCMYGYDSSNGIGTLPASALSFAYIGAINTRLLTNISFDVYNPASASTRSALTAQTTYQSSAGPLAYSVGGLNYTVSAATDGFQISLSGGTASGNVRIYGYRTS